MKEKMLLARFMRNENDANIKKVSVLFNKKKAMKN